MSTLSVVLISRNQEWNITRLVTSVLKETEHIQGTEIVLVDSASQDRTAETAARYPIKVLRLHPNQHLSASAGRYVGCKNTSGDFVLFLDGDMELRKGWLDQAFNVLRSKPDVAVVCGQVIDRPIAPQNPTDEPVLPDPQTDADTEAVPHGGGAAMYRRSVLEQVGSFNPYLYSDEEPELCLRIRHAGYHILRLLRPIVFHYTVPPEELSYFVLRRSNRMMLGYGQVMRSFLGTSLFLPYLRERGWAIAPALAIVAGAAAVAVSTVTRQWWWAALFLGGLLLLIFTTAIRKRSLKRALLVLFRRLLILDGTVRGLLLKPYDPQSYSGTFDTVR